MGTQKLRSESPLKSAFPKKGFHWLHLLGVSALFGIIGTIYVLTTSAAGTATLTLTSSRSSVKAGDQFQVQVRLNTTSQAVNALETNVTYNPAQLEFVSVVDATPPWDVNQNTPTSGNVNLVRGTYTSVNDASALVATVTFRALTTSATSTIGLSGSTIVRLTDGTDVFGSATGTSVIIDNTNPTITMTAPSNGAVVRQTINTAFTATDTGGIANVQVLVDGAVVNTLTTSPYTGSLNTTTLSDGTHTVQGRATDSVGNVATSAIATITVDNTAPVAAVTAPAPNTKARGSLQITATATDARGIANVAFLVDGVVIGTDTTAPYAQNWDTTTATAGAHTISVRATDNSGNTVVSSGVSVTIDNALPSVSITAPTQNATVSGTIPVTASASDTNGIAQVEILINGTVASTLTASPYTYNFNTQSITNGSTVAISARATDTYGNVATSANVTVTVERLSGDITGDNVVNIFDLSRLLANWGMTTNLGRTDINKDGVVNIFDLSMLLAQWGRTA